VQHTPSENRVAVLDARSAANDAVAIECKGLTKIFIGGAVPAVDDVSLSIRENEFFTLLGPSGCGKTTTLRLIAGFETPDSGSIFLRGQRLDGLPPFRRPVNTVFQSYAVFPHMTVAQNVAFGLEMRRMPRDRIAAKVAEMLTLVKMTGLETRRPDQLSGGQQQRVALARALANEPRVLLLDEPLAALDRKLRGEMQLELKRLQTEVGITFLFVTHDQHEAMTMSDRLAVMHAGKVLQVGTPVEVYEHPVNRFVADFLGETNLIDAMRVGPTRFRLKSGVELDSVEPGPAVDRVTLAIRPERARLVTSGPEGVRGIVEQIVYDGADTTYHVSLPDRTRLRVLEQNRDGRKPLARIGDPVGVALPPPAIRVLGE
jgi:spermidine/putrescine transport system ATP-binding protein